MAGGGAQDAWARLCAKACTVWQALEAGAEDRARRLAKHVAACSMQLYDLGKQGALHSLEAAQRGSIMGANMTARALREGKDEAISLASRLAVELQENPAFQLRAQGEGESLAVTLARWNIDVVGVADKFSQQPTPLAMAVGFLAVRTTAAGYSLIDSLIHSLLYQRTLLSRTVLLGVAASSTAALRHYSQLVCQEVGVSTNSSFVERCSQVASNAARLPALFWFSMTLSGTLALQAVKDLLASALRRLLARRLRTVGLSAVCAVMVARAYRSPTLKDAQHSCRKVVADLCRFVQQASAKAMGGKPENKLSNVSGTVEMSMLRGKQAGGRSDANSSQASTATVASTGESLQESN
mmetsp:Transcript_5062/g.12138  ORF Transcript_5062/g.12138 Transcript_5062/m.12138 type:complete len:354 (+) Transcript_5062:48-1109(+)